MDNPYAPSGSWSKNSTKKTYNSFQSELSAKMKERKRMGLTSDLTPSASERGSGDELASDDDLMGQFNMTSKSKSKQWNPPGHRKSPGFDRMSPSSNRSKSPYDSLRRSPATDLIFGKKTSVTEDDDDDEDEDDFGAPSNLMMTMKKPFNPSTLGRGDASKTLPNPKTRKSKAFDVLNERDEKERTWTPPSFKKSEEQQKENRPMRPKSPRGRKTPNLGLDAIEEEDKPAERRARFSDEQDSFLKPKPKPRGRASPMRLRDEDEDDEMRMLSARGESPKDSGLFGRSHNDRRSPDRRTPSYGRQTPSEGKRTPTDNRRTPTNARRTPSDEKFNLFGRKTPTMERDSSPEGRDPYQRRNSKDGRGTPSDGRKSGGRKTPVDGRRTPKDDNKFTSDGRRTPTAASRRNRDENESPMLQKKSMMDMFSASSEPSNKKKSGRKDAKTNKKSLLHESSSDDDDVGMGAPRESPMSLARGRGTPEDRVHRGPSLRGRDTPEDDVDGFRGPRPARRNRSPGYGSPTMEDVRGRGRKDMEEDEIEEGRRSAFRPMPARRSDERGRSSSRGNKTEERESSTCREIEHDPTLKKQKEQVKQKKLAKAHTTMGRDLENAISSVEIAQDNTMRFIDPDKEQKKEETEQEKSPTPGKVPKHRPKPRYAKPTLEKNAEKIEFNSTTDIKQAVYNQWYAERMERAKQERKEKLAKEKEKQDKIKREKEDKFINAKASYQAWMESKKDYDQNRKKKVLNEEEAKMKKVEEEEEKRKHAVLAYRSWKDEKDARLREEERKKRREEERKQEEEQNLKNTKKKESQSAFNGWKNRKDVQIKKNMMQTKKTQRQKQDDELEEQRQRDREARESYLRWMDRKEKQQYSARKTKRHVEDDEERPPWSPANRTIPVGR